MEIEKLLKANASNTLKTNIAEYAPEMLEYLKLIRRTYHTIPCDINLKKLKTLLDKIEGWKIT